MFSGKKTTRAKLQVSKASLFSTINTLRHCGLNISKMYVTINHIFLFFFFLNEVTHHPKIPGLDITAFVFFLCLLS